MKPRFALAALTTAVLLTACAAPGAGGGPAAKAAAHAAHHPASATSGAAPAAGPGANPQPGPLGDMQAMRDRMMNARTPAERQALMDEHMKAMHEGMSATKGMQGMGPMHGKPDMADKIDMSMHMSQHHQKMEMRMDMMQTMMEMMMQRMPGANAPAAPPSSQ